MLVFKNGAISYLGYALKSIDDISTAKDGKGMRVRWELEFVKDGATEKSTVFWIRADGTRRNGIKRKLDDVPTKKMPRCISCTQEGKLFPKQIQTGGVCVKHGAKLRRCSHRTK